MNELDEIKQQFMTALEIMKDPKLTRIIADMTWQLFTDLKAKGFTGPK